MYLIGTRVFGPAHNGAEAPSPGAFTFGSGTLVPPITGLKPRLREKRGGVEGKSVLVRAMDDGVQYQVMLEIYRKAVIFPASDGRFTNGSSH